LFMIYNMNFLIISKTMKYAVLALIALSFVSAD